MKNGDFFEKFTENAQFTIYEQKPGCAEEKMPIFSWTSQLATEKCKISVIWDILQKSDLLLIGSVPQLIYYTFLM